MCIKGEVEVGKREIVCLYLNDKFMMILCSGDGDWWWKRVCARGMGTCMNGIGEEEECDENLCRYCVLGKRRKGKSEGKVRFGCWE